MAYADVLCLEVLEQLVLASPGCLEGGRRRSSHSHTTMCILLVVDHIKYTWRRDNDFNVHACVEGYPLAGAFHIAAAADARMAAFLVSDRRKSKVRHAFGPPLFSALCPRRSLVRPPR